MARQHRFVGRSVGGGPLNVCMIAFSDLWYSLSFFPANMAITAILFIWMACKAGELKHLWLSMNRPPTLSGVVSICSNIHNLCLATYFLPFLCIPQWPRKCIALMKSGSFLVKVR